LKANPYWHDGIRYGSPATGPSGGLQYQADLNRDGRVNSQDASLALAQGAGNATDWRYNVDFRIGTVGTDSFSIPAGVGTGTITATDIGPVTSPTDKQVVQHIIDYGIANGLCVAVGSDPCGSGGVTWPPPSGSVTGQYLNPPGPQTTTGKLTLAWPDANNDNKVDVSDVIAVFSHEFVPITDGSGNIISTAPYMDDVTFAGAIDISSLTTTFVRQFTTPPGVTT